MAQNSLRLVEDKDVDKTKALEAALGQIERAFGKGSIMKLGKNEQVVEIETVSTGSLGLDIALGIGGLPKGRIIEIRNTGFLRAYPDSLDGFRSCVCGIFNQSSNIVDQSLTGFTSKYAFGALPRLGITAQVPWKASTSAR